MKLLPNFMDCLNIAASQNAPAVLITITRTKGSAPRNAGTKMAVALQAEDASQLFVGGTIGGGNLEFKALEIAQNLLQSSANDTLETPENRAFPLGASLGQCCGGWVEMRFEVITAAQNLAPANWIQTLRNAPPPNSFSVMLFGAGHVAQALAPMLSAIGAKVVWVDNREGAFTWGNHIASANIETITTDAPEAEIARAPRGTYFIVMTHSHALDQVITHAMLQRDDAHFYGLIGSKTKRKLFENRLFMRGLSQSLLEKLVCPLGIEGIKSKEPAAIALAITAQIQQRKEQLAVTAQITSQNDSHKHPHYA